MILSVNNNKIFELSIGGKVIFLYDIIIFYKLYKIKMVILS